MNKIIIDFIPSGNFVEVSAYQTEWRTRFLEAVRKQEHIRYRIDQMPAIPGDIASELSKQGYRESILKDDDWHRFLIPIGK